MIRYFSHSFTFQLDDSLCIYLSHECLLIQSRDMLPIVYIRLLKYFNCLSLVAVAVQYKQEQTFSYTFVSHSFSSSSP